MFGFHIRGKTHVIFHISSAHERCIMNDAFKLLVQRTGSFAENVDEDIQAAPVRHANDDFSSAKTTSAFYDFIE